MEVVHHSAGVQRLTCLTDLLDVGNEGVHYAPEHGDVTAVSPQWVRTTTRFGRYPLDLPEEVPRVLLTFQHHHLDDVFRQVISEGVPFLKFRLNQGEHHVPMLNAHRLVFGCHLDPGLVARRSVNNGVGIAIPILLVQNGHKLVYGWELPQPSPNQ
ncbi:hypothetical protein D3C86_1366330 [compost metagenome]